MRKLIAAAAAAAVVVLALGAGTGNASAFENIAVWDTFSATLTTSFSLGSFLTCNVSHFSGPIVTDDGMDAGGDGDISSATWTSCTGPFGTPATVAANNLTWLLAFDGGGFGSIAGVDLTLAFGSNACRYTGWLSFQYDAADWGGNGDAPLSGSLTRQAGSTSLCTSLAAVSGTYNIVGPNGVIDL